MNLCAGDEGSARRNPAGRMSKIVADSPKSSLTLASNALSVAWAWRGFKKWWIR